MTRPRDIADSINRINSSAADATAMTIDSSENVGVGITSSLEKFTVANTSSGIVGRFTNNINQTLDLGITSGSGSAGGAYLNNANSGYLAFQSGGTERMRIDSSGNLLVGKTVTTQNTAGTLISAINGVRATVDQNVASILNRTTSNGDIVSLRKDGTEIGSFGIFGGNTLLLDGPASVYVANNFRPNANDTHDLGSASLKWRDIYTQGAVNTSDRNEKQQIAELTATELAAAKRISALFKTFKWNNAVEKKGDNARTHAGIIAQDVRDALVAEGLDAGDYAFWCSNTWWEHDVEVPAVEAVAEVLDDDGNVVTEAVEAQEAYTRTDIYDTADEAPEGATERTSQSVRYNELMAFVGAATEQRLTHLETLEARIEALENA